MSVIVDAALEENLQTGISPVLVFLNDSSAQAAALGAPSVAGAAGAATVTALSHPLADTGRRILQHFLDKISDEAQISLSVRAGLAKVELTVRLNKPRVFSRLGIAYGVVDRERFRALKENNEVKALYAVNHLELIKPTKTSVAGALTAESHTWGVRSIEAPEIWDQGFTGKGVRVAHLDTGVDASHPALQGRVKAFHEVTLDGDEPDNVAAYDSGLHGTHTAGTICGGTIGTTHIGVAPEAELYCAHVIEGGDMLRVLVGMEWALSQNVHILNMSLGILGYNPFLLGVTHRLRQAGVLPVFAIGNSGPNTSCSPGNYPDALAVGAIDAQNTVAAFSSSMVFDRPADPSQPNVVAPGVNILSCVPGGGAERLDGTSMATPHVAGLAALLKACRPDATVDQIENAIVSSCEPLPAQDRERFGAGRVRGLKALEKVSQIQSGSGGQSLPGAPAVAHP